MVSERLCKRDIIPTRIQELIGESRSYIETGKGSGRSGLRGYYQQEDGKKIAYGDIPLYAVKGKKYSNLTSAVSGEEMAEIRSRTGDKSDENEPEPESSPTPTPTPTTETEETPSPQDPGSETDPDDDPGSEEDPTQDPEDDPTEGSEEQSEENAGTVVPETKPRKIKPKTSVKDKAEQKELERVLERESNIDTSADLSPRNSMELPEDQTYVLSWKGFSSEFSKWGGFFKDMYKHLITCATQGDKSAFQTAVLGITAGPVMDRVFSANTRLESMFKSAGIKNGDIDKWMESHKGTTKARLIKEKASKMVAGSTKAIATYKGILAKAVLKDMIKDKVDEKGNPHKWTEEEIKIYMADVRAGRKDNFLDNLTLTKETRESILEQVMGEAKKIKTKIAQAKKGDVAVSAEYLSYYDMVKGMEDGEEFATKILSDEKTYAIMRRDLLSQGFTEEQVKEKIAEAKKTAESNGLYKHTKTHSDRKSPSEVMDSTREAAQQLIVHQFAGATGSDTDEQQTSDNPTGSTVPVRNSMRLTIFDLKK